MEFLYEKLTKKLEKEEISPLPNEIIDNLKYEVRPYQIEAFRRFMFYYSQDFKGKPNPPFHLLFNMATGSGKTLIMAGLMLHLYKKGYRNFLFFVNSNNIIQKTKDNFLNPQASKYLFNDRITINGKKISIKGVENFDEADDENINIKFTTIHQLHINLNSTKENSISYSDFEDKKFILIADEAHHLSSNTKNKKRSSDSWENTVEEILRQNLQHILLEFTATINYETTGIIEKYKDKVLYKYDLAKFRIDKYSKEINLIQSQYKEDERIIQALLLNIYRQELATVYDISLKPVILFKSKRYIKESEKNKEHFHELIADFSVKDIHKIRNTSTVAVVQKALKYFEKKGLSDQTLVKRIQFNFKRENCLSANNDKEAEKNQMLLNTLEDENNPIRAVFAVHKLNEGWDVLSLFDIVLLYEGKSEKKKQSRKSTISEAQLIGRGARYFPFITAKGQEKYTRKFDEDFNNDLRILEELYYHTKEDSRYISDLKEALVEIGIYEADKKIVTKQFKLKPSFKNTSFYKKGQILINKRIPNHFHSISSLKDDGLAKKNNYYRLSSGIGKTSNAFSSDDKVVTNKAVHSKQVAIAEISNHIIRYALSQNPFYYFSNLLHYFPNLKSTSNFIVDKAFLSQLEITFKGSEQRLNKINQEDYLQGINQLLNKIQRAIESHAKKYKGSEYELVDFHQVFKDKEIHINGLNQIERVQDKLNANQPWSVYNIDFTTDQEKEFIDCFTNCYKDLSKELKNIYLVRNEKQFKIYDEQGRAFAPDYILFCKQKVEKQTNHQVFIDMNNTARKSKTLVKDVFSKELKERQQKVNLQDEYYHLSFIQFDSFQSEKQFKMALLNVLD